MGTRSLTHIYDAESGQILVTMYRQMDGYPSGHGQELADFLKEITIVNGISLSEKRKVANGVEDLAAQLVCHFKQGSPVGGIYLYKPGSRNCWEEYVYIVKVKDGQITLKALKAGHEALPNYPAEDDKTIFDGSPTDFDGEAVEKGKVKTKRNHKAKEVA